MGKRFIGSTVHVNGRRFDAGTPESEIPDDYAPQIGEHIWKDEQPQDVTPDEEQGYGLIASLRIELSTRDAENSVLRQENQELKAEVERLGGDPVSQSSVPPAEAGSGDQTDLSSLNHEQLLSLANDRGIVVDQNASKKQIIAALQA